jgi:hypothetical protein
MYSLTLKLHALFIRFTPVLLLGLLGIGIIINDPSLPGDIGLS